MSRNDDKTGSVYILHFDKPWGKFKNIRHYTGFTTLAVDVRAERHRSGHGSKFVAKSIEKGNNFVIGYMKLFETAKEARRGEIRVKKERLSYSLCAYCHGDGGDLP
tara:strand:+ start:3168 stop:3485 length:318 start_codon:yes stop_codon:yes gene_type:complete